MNRKYPIFTEETDCRDCYKCVRRCPVKAIKIEDGHATVIAERCIACGICVDTCPAGAKKVRADLGRAKSLLKRPGKVIASLAPSYAAEWPGVPAANMAGAIKQLGFHTVSETALGAEAVSLSLAESFRNARPGLHISTACPVVVDLIRKYQPRFTENLTPLLSPMQAHARLLKQHYGEDTHVVFIGPCIAKKNECDELPGLTDLALTFMDLAQWFEQEGIDPASAAPHPFEPEQAVHGALYPVVGGMNRTLEDYDLPNVELLSASGMETILQTLENLDTAALTEPVFLEALACPGGCIGGPRTNGHEPLLTGELAVRKRARGRGHGELTAPAPGHIFEAAPQEPDHVSEAEIRAALRLVGKHRAEDELNCGGCGYETCRSFAQALLTHKAEPDMCLSHLRKLAQNKANALLRRMPSGVVIVDENLHIVECNENFARTAGADTLLGYAAKPGMAGADLRKILSFAKLFEQVKRTGREYRSDTLRDGDKLLNVSIFPIEDGKTIGGILLDVTKTEHRREMIAQKAKEVIEKNMVTVQDIACMLGEHMADTEILLRSIANDYSDTSD
jgi:iron only hydrogenase large subunit-like protein